MKFFRTKDFIPIIAILSNFSLDIAQANYSNDDDLGDLKGLSGKITQAITLTNKEQASIDPGWTPRYHYKNVLFFVKGNIENSAPFFKTYCKLRSKDEDSVMTKIEPSWFTITRVRREVYDSDDGRSNNIVLSTNQNFDVVCRSGPGVWRNVEQRFKLDSNGMQLKNLKNAFGNYVEF